MSGSELVGCHSDLFVQHELEACFNGVGVVFVIYRHGSSAEVVLTSLFSYDFDMNVSGQKWWIKSSGALPPPIATTAGARLSRPQPHTQG